MASAKFIQFGSKVSEDSKLAAKYGSEYWKNMDVAKYGSEYWKNMNLAKSGSDYYEQLLEKNKHYIQEPANSEQCNLMAKKLRYTWLASLPERYKSMWKEFNHVKHLLKNGKELTTTDAGIATLFAMECLFYIKAGEVIGRGGTLTGYHV